jgi:cysteine desulfuration protein SufE
MADCVKASEISWLLRPQIDPCRLRKIALPPGSSHFYQVTIGEKQEQLAKALSALPTAQDRLAYVVGRGRAAALLDESLKTDAFRVEGCLAKVWFVPKFSNGRCHFKADSDSAIVKGIAVLLCDFYSGQTPEEITQTEPAFLEKFGITQHLTPNRRNGLAKIRLAIDTFARAQLKE